MPRKIIRSLRIDEISAVDRPAQVGARFTLMKRAGDTSAHDDNPVTKETPMDGKEYEDMTGAEKAMHDKLKKADEDAAALAKAQQVIALKADERAHYDTLKDADAEAFLAKSDVERGQVVAKASEADAPVYTCKADGREIRKSDGPNMLAMAKALDDQAERLAKAEAREEHATLMKRAETDLATHTGTLDERAAVIKAVEGIPDEALRKRGLEILKAGPVNDAAMNSLGSTGGSPMAKSATDAKVEFDGKVSEIAKRDGVSEHAAFGKAMREHPALAKAMDDVEG